MTVEEAISILWNMVHNHHEEYSDSAEAYALLGEKARLGALVERMPDESRLEHCDGIWAASVMDNRRFFEAPTPTEVLQEALEGK